MAIRESQKAAESANRVGPAKVRQCSRQTGNGIKNLGLSNKNYRYEYNADKHN